MISSLDNNKKTTIRVLFLISLFLFAYTFIRACLLSIVDDESFTYLFYVRKNFTTFTNYNIYDANNHILNTWLIELSIKLFGTSELTIRLPNLFAHILFIIFSAKLVLNLHSRLLIIGSFIILDLNPFLLDFFSK